MLAIHRGRSYRRWITWLASLALFVVSFEGAVMTSAAASTPANGSLQVCLSANATHAATFNLSGNGVHRTLHMTARLHHNACATVNNLRPGKYTVTQRLAAGAKVRTLSVSPASWAYSRNPGHGTAIFRLWSHRMTKVFFGNYITPKPVPPAPAGKGFVEVCKYVGDMLPEADASVSINGRAPIIVPVGQCTGPIEVYAGTATIKETIAPAYYLAKVTTSPSSALKSVNLTTATATVTVAKSTTSAVETVVNLWNKTKFGQFKICKVLDQSAGDVAKAGTYFTFLPWINTGGSSWKPLAPVKVRAPQVGVAACVLYPQSFRLGTLIKVTELRSPYTTLTGITVGPGSQLVNWSWPIDHFRPANTVYFKLGPNLNGIVTATFTNRADGTIEICKAMKDGSTYYPPFQFLVNGRPYWVQAGHCTNAITVPVGTATVQEVLPKNAPYSFVGMTAKGPDGSSRLISGTNPIKVKVVWGGVGNETTVFAVNQLMTGQVKVCKTLVDGAPSGMYTLTLSFANGAAPQTVDLYFPKFVRTLCSGLSTPVPLVDQFGKPMTFTVSEKSGPTAPVKITYDGNGTLLGTPTVYHLGDTVLPCYSATATLGLGVNEMTFTNVLLPCPPKA